MKGCNHTTGYISAFGAVFMAMDSAAAAMKCGRPQKFSLGRWKTTEKMTHDEQRGRRPLKLKAPPSDTTAAIATLLYYTVHYPSDDGDIVTTDVWVAFELGASGIQHKYASPTRLDYSS